LADLDGLQPDEQEPLTEAEVSPLREQLERIAWEKVQPYLAAERIKYANVRAARGLLELRARFAGDGALFRPVQGDLLFECHVPGVGDKATLYVPLILARSAINAVNRLVNSMKVKKSDLRVNKVLAHLEREIEAKRRQVV